MVVFGQINHGEGFGDGMLRRMELFLLSFGMHFFFMLGFQELLKLVALPALLFLEM